LIGEGARPESNEAKALASVSDAPERKAKRAGTKPVNRKPRRRQKAAPERDRSILDPWN